MLYDHKHFNNYILNLDSLSSATVTVAPIHWPNSLTKQILRILWCLYSDLLKAIELNQTRNNLWQLPQLSSAGVIQQDRITHLFMSPHLSTLYYPGSLSNLQLGQCVVSTEAIWGKPSLLLAITITPFLTSLLLDVRSQYACAEDPLPPTQHPQRELNDMKQHSIPIWSSLLE